MSLFILFLGAIFVNNFIFSKFLGICPFLGVSKKVETAAGMGVAVIFVITLASAATWVVYNLVLVKLGLEYLYNIAFILIIASLVQFVEMFIKKSSPSLYQALGVYLPLITTAPIAAADKKTTEESMNAVLADAQWGETVEVNYETGDDNGTVITSYTPGLNPDGSIKGYAVSVTTKGFSAGLKLMYGIDANSNDDNGTDEGTITGLSVVDNSNETPGLGANSSKPEWSGQFAGKKGELQVTKTGDATDSQINAITGATITSKAVTLSANDVSKYYEDTIKKEGNK